jgi:broad specificity phosphatase PhoE
VLCFLQIQKENLKTSLSVQDVTFCHTNEAFSVPIIKNKSTMMNRMSLFMFLFAVPSSRAMSTISKSVATATATIATGGWSDIAIKAAQDFTVSQREKLRDLGALDIQRPIRIIGEPVGTENSLLEEEDTKIIHFQRHGQGYHNLICDMMREQGMVIDFDSPDPKFNPVVRQEFLDPALTSLGVAQCKARRPDCSQLNPELIIVSPLLRCLQTAKLSFRDHTHVPWVSHEGSREELGLLVGNKRRPLSEIKEDYPEVDFSPIQYEEDVLWENYGDKRETLLEKSERIYDFLTEFVMKRPEKEIAIVCHSAYLFTLLNAVMDIEEDDLRYWFLTSEVRSVKVRFSKNEEAEKSI